MTGRRGWLRGRSGPLPPELPIHRSDEVGALAREVALLAGERNASEFRREENNCQIAALNDAISDAIFRVDRDGVILNFQPPRDAPFFLNPEPAVGRKLGEIFPESVTDRSIDALASVFVSDAPQQFDFQLELQEETRSYQARFARASQNEVLAIVRDVTRVRKTASTRARLNTILDATLDPVVTVTADGEIRYINPAGRLLLGIRAAALRSEADRLPPGMGPAADLQDRHSHRHRGGRVARESALLTTDEVEVRSPSPPFLTRRTTARWSSCPSSPATSRSGNASTTICRSRRPRPLTSLYTRKRFVEELGRESPAPTARAPRGGGARRPRRFQVRQRRPGHRNGDRLSPASRTSFARRSANDSSRGSTATSSPSWSPRPSPATWTSSSSGC
jgi:PAS domain-containing protein